LGQRIRIQNIEHYYCNFAGKAHNNLDRYSQGSERSQDSNRGKNSDNNSNPDREFDKGFERWLKLERFLLSQQLLLARKAEERIRDNPSLTIVIPLTHFTIEMS